MLIKFFGLNLELNKIAFSIFDINIYWYAILIVSAVVIGILIFKIKDGLYNVKYETIIELLLYLLPISIISARLYYVIFDFQYYFEYPLKIFDFRSGGLAIYGGIIGGIITAYIFCKSKKINLLDLLDYIAPCLALGQSIGRWGNFINVEAYGTETTLPWKMGIFENGIYKEVHPAFLYESIGTFIIFLILIIIQNKRKFKGEITYIYLILYSFIRFFVEGIRIDSLMLFNFRISQILSIIIFVVSCSFIIYNVKNIKKNNQKTIK